MNGNEQNKDWLEKKTVFIIDEDQKMVEWLSICCRTIGFEVWPATPTEAASVMDRGFPDLVLVDSETKTRDGESFLQAWDSQEELEKVPAIILCNSPTFESVYRVQNICAYYVHKSPDAWTRINIFANELVDLGSKLAIEPSDETHPQSDLH